MPGAESAFPVEVDVLPTNVGAKTGAKSGTPNPDDTPSHHSDNHNIPNAGIMAIQKTIGTPNPQGKYKTIKERLDAMEAATGTKGLEEETKARVGADTALASGITAEETRAKAAEAAVKAEVKTEKERAEAAEGGAVAKSIGTTKGDVIAFEAGGKPVRVAVGATDGMVLQADSAAAAGVSYARRSQITGVRPQKVPSGKWVAPYCTATGTVQITSKDLLLFMPIDLYEEETFSAIGVKVEAKGEGTGLVARLGVWSDDGTGTAPKALLKDYGTVSVESIGEKSIAAKKAYGPGRIWISIVIQGTAMTVGPTLVSATLVTGATRGLDNLGNNSTRVLAQAGVTEALPAEVGTLERKATSPLLGLKVE